MSIQENTEELQAILQQVLELPNAEGTESANNIPTYHYVEAGRVADKILAWKAQHANNLIFGVVSDIHVCNDGTAAETRTKTAIDHAAFALETVGAMVGADFVADLGDNGKANGIDNANDLLAAKYSINALAPAFERLTCFNLVGNHDKCESTQTQFDLIGSWNDFDVAASTEIRGFGYKDYTAKKVRVIGLHTNDYLNGSDGGFAFSYEQKDFLMRALDLSSKADAASWQILMLSHFPIDWNGGNFNTYADIQTILKAYENGTSASITVNSSHAFKETPSNYPTYSGGNLVYNYSGKNAAKLIGNIHGHIHNNKVGKIANTGIVRVATPNTTPDGNKSESYPDYGDYSISSAEAAKIVKVNGTAKDTSATFYCIDLDEQVIYAFGYGADVDRTISYRSISQYTVTYNLTNVTSSSNTAVIPEDGSFTTMLTAKSGYEMSTVTVTMGGVDVTSSAYSGGDINIKHVTGNIVITATATAVKSYTNVIDTAGTTNGVRLRSGGATGDADGFASGYFAAKGGDVIRVYFPNGDRSKIPSNGVYCCTYSNTSGTLVTAYDASNTNIVKNLTATGYEVHIPTSVNCSYAKVAGGPKGGYAGWIVTVNEVIE